ncbi:hypothetical protein ISG33_15715 [Glaciecola sp. MH2013]|uniref:hypothetical protein n=1 Tax=Glaciecola sp. MH2013 TaxID=2785524 RepID=UPI0018A011D6|nr:hypothetical protein [Glaciecola sp. MH2013]MBF7074849.1 hypothetical protein [Glaciecola sp. MH2013]
MREINEVEIELISGAGDIADAAQGAVAGGAYGAGAIGIAVAIGATVTAPVTIGVIAVAAVAGATYEFLTD